MGNAVEKNEERIEHEIETGNDEDLFDEAFGKDPEREQARKRMRDEIEKEVEKEERTGKRKKKENEEKMEPIETQTVQPKKKIRLSVEVIKQAIAREQNKEQETERMELKASEKEFTDKKTKKVKTEKKSKKEKSETETENETEEDNEEVEVEEETKEVEIEEEDEEQNEPEKMDVKEEEEKIGEIEKSIQEIKMKEKLLKEIKSEKVIEPMKPELRLLPAKKENTVFIGRNRSLQAKYGDEGGLYIGKIAEPEFGEKEVLLDSLNPHVVFVCGARGSGKSYSLGILAEELALQNPNVATVVIDPIGVFWSMRFPNQEERELELLDAWQLKPQGLENISVFIPKGMEKETPKDTFDNTFSIQPSMLTAQDWCLTFGIDRFSPSGLLLETALNKVKKGFRNLEGKEIQGSGENYSLEDLIYCMENDADLNSRDKGYKSDSIRALTSRLEAAKTWGVFDSEGTPLGEVCREGQLTVIDTSFLDENVTALIIGLLARRILSARKLSTRKEAAKKFEESKTAELLELDIPPTWLFIDEAHTLIPAGNLKTPATDALVEYVKQGRRPGCSLVFATQQPSAIDTKVLSQLDIILINKLVFNDDIKAVIKRTPAIVPGRYKRSVFIKTLPMGVAVAGDRREESSRVFKMCIRPRMSQHEGREAETVEVSRKLKPEQVRGIIGELCYKILKRNKHIEKDKIKMYTDSLNKKYKTKVKTEDIIEDLIERGALEEEIQLVLNVALAIEETPIRGEVSVKKKEFPRELIALEDQVKQVLNEPNERERGIKEIETHEVQNGGVEEEEPTTTLVGFPVNVNKESAIHLLDKVRKKKVLGLGSEEYIEEMELKVIPVYKIEFNFYLKGKEFKQGNMYVNSLTGEFLHYGKDKFEESQGLKELYKLSAEELAIVNAVGGKPKVIEEVMEWTGLSESVCRKILKEFTGNGTVQAKDNGKQIVYCLSKAFDLPASPFHELHSSLNKVPLMEIKVGNKVTEKINRQQAIQLLQRIWPNLIVQNVRDIYWPVWEGKMRKPNSKRLAYIDAVTGKELNL